MIGRSIAHYEVTEQIGVGGMGEVYRATDTKLNRKVALKILPDAFARDHERMARFAREAQLLASLNHPNIAAIYGMEEAGGVRCLVLELVEGETLADRIARSGPVPIDEALAIARQIADALETAHERGIIHRDLKPANIKLTDDGKVKVLDFGLAKALEDEIEETNSAHSPTLSMAATRAGVILGTAAYMSPEQAKGKRVDRRADIWAFGIVLYEMLTGKQMFTGETTSDILAAVIMTEPDLRALPPDTPPGIRRLLQRCFVKDPRSRLRDIGDARITLEESMSGAPESEAETVAPGAAMSLPGHRVRARIATALGTIVIAAVAAIIGWIAKPGEAPLPLRKFEITLQDPIASTAVRSTFAIAPDGSKIAYTTAGRLWVRDLDRLVPHELAHTDGAIKPFWSPDGAWIAYGAQNKLWKIPVAGGQPTAICPLDVDFNTASGGSWGTDGRIVFCTGGAGLEAVSAQGGDPVTILEPDEETEVDFHDVSALPDGRGYVFVVHRKEATDTIALVADGERKTLLQFDGQVPADPMVSRTGHLLFRRTPTNAGIWATPFSLAALEITGEPFLVAADGYRPRVADDGTLVYLRASRVSMQTQTVWVNRDGRVEGTIGRPLDNQWPYPALSPDERQVAVRVRGDDGADLFIHDVTRGTSTRLTFEDENELWPEWSASGDVIFYQVLEPNRVMARAADGSGEPELIADGAAPFLSLDGRYLFYHVHESDWDIWYMPLDYGDPDAGGRAGVPEPGEPLHYIGGIHQQTAPRLSPDGRYVVYQSDESGRTEVYITRFPVAEGKWQVSLEGGQWPRWNGDGSELYYVAGDRIMVVDVTTEPSLRLSTPRELFRRPLTGTRFAYDWIDGFDVTGDGQRFVMIQSLEEGDGAAQADDVAIVVVQSWFAEFEGQ